MQDPSIGENMTELHPLTSREHEGDHSNEETLIELQENVHQEVPDNTEDNDEDNLTEMTFAEISKIHLKNFIEIPKVDPITKEKITFGSAFGKGFIATILLAVR